MAFHNNLRLLILSFSLLIALHLARPDPSPTISPILPPDSSPEPGPIPTPSLGPATALPADGPTPSPSPSPNYVSFPPSISDPPPASISPTADGPTESDVPSPSISPTAEGPTESDGPNQSISPVADGPTESDGPSLFEFSMISPSDDDVNPKVKEICDSTDYPSLCLATVIPLLNDKDDDDNDDVPSVLEVAMWASAKLSSYGLSLAKSLAEKPGTPPELLSVLNDCKDGYDTAVDNFQNAMDAFPKRDIGTMNSMLSAVITNVGDCEDGFLGIGEKSLLSGIADKLTNMTSNCLAIVSLLD